MRRLCSKEGNSHVSIVDFSLATQEASDSAGPHERQQFSGPIRESLVVNPSSMLLCTLSSDVCLQMNSPFQLYLDSNHAPSEDECRQIAQIVAEQDNRISQIDERIDRLQLLLQPLLREKGEVQASRQAHRRLLCPSRRMPYEIWSEIFVQCLPSGKFVRIDFQEAPMLLAQVCSSWRSIVLSTPKLWNTLSVGGRNGMDLASQSPLILKWLARSGNLPLSIEIAENGLPNPHQERDFVNAFIPFTPQIKDLTIYAPQSMIERLIGSQDISGLINLKVVITNALDDGQPLNISDSATRLRNLSVINYGFGLNNHGYPWTQLTEFDAEYVHLNECFEIFRQCHNLSRLILRHISGWYDGVTRSRVMIPNLVSLELEMVESMGCLLNNLVLPKLQEANFDIWGENFWPKSELFALLDRSSSSLCRLRIPDDIPEGDLVECVERIPSLRNIIIWDSYVETPLPDRISRMLAQRAASTMNLD